MWRASVFLLLLAACASPQGSNARSASTGHSHVVGAVEVASPPPTTPRMGPAIATRELEGAGVVVTFPDGWAITPAAGGFVAREPNGTGAIALVGAAVDDFDMINELRHELEGNAQAQFPIGLGQRTTTAKGYPFFLQNQDTKRPDGSVVCTSTGMSATATTAQRKESLPDSLALFVWFRHDAPEARDAIMAAIDSIGPSESAKRQQSIR